MIRTFYAIGLFCSLFVAAACLPVTAQPMPPAAVTLGDEIFLRDTWRELNGRCVGVVTNQSGVTSQLEPIVDAIRRNPAICLRAVYSPEHGLRGDQAAGKYVPSYTDPRSGLPVYSLYGATRRPSAAVLAGVDVLLVDLQDVGSRTYTYISTMAYVMEAAKSLGKEVWILDRPNPLGDVVEGPVLDPHFSSFVGLYPIALRHGMTVGELARMFNDRFAIGCKLRVITMRGYRDGMVWPDTGLSWVQTSPNMPEWETTFVYPATGLIAAANINNGTDFTKPFRYAGGFAYDADRLAEYLNDRPLPGVHFRPAYWTPFAGFWQDKRLAGTELMVFNLHTFRSVRTAIEIIGAVRALDPTAIQFARTFDRDWGTDVVRRGFERGESVDQIEREVDAGLPAFREQRARYLLYNDASTMPATPL